MPQITAREIPPGSYSLRIFGDDVVPNEADIETVLVLRNNGDGVCEAALAHGDLYAAANELIGLKAYELGFKILKFHALKHVKVTRWAAYLSEDEHFKYYEIDLEAAISFYLSQGAL